MERSTLAQNKKINNDYNEVKVTVIADDNLSLDPTFLGDKTFQNPARGKENVSRKSGQGKGVLKAENSGSFEETLERSGLSTLVEKAGSGSVGKSLTDLDVTLQENIVGVKLFSELLKSLSNTERLRILIYCLKPQRFADITKDLRLNTRSFTYHLEKLEKFELLKKTNSKYLTTEVGKTTLEVMSTFILALQ